MGAQACGFFRETKKDGGREIGRGRRRKKEEKEEKGKKPGVSL